MPKKTKILVFALTLPLFAACGEDDDDTGGNGASNTVVDIAVANGGFTTLVGALEATGLDQTLQGAGPFTVFAPTDAAFELLPTGLLESLDNATLTAILQYHVVSGEVKAAQVIGLTGATTLQGGEVQISVPDGAVVLDGRVQVTTTDIEADNGVIHVLDAVLVPGEFPGTVVDVLAASPRFSDLVGAVGTAGLAGALSDAAATLTVFAPSNGAFSRLPNGLVGSLDASTLGDVLQNHVLATEVDAATAIGVANSSDPSATTLLGGAINLDVDAGSVVIDGRSQVAYTDISTQNGIVHVLDSVLIPGVFPGNLVEALSSYPRFDSLVDAIDAAGLVSTLSDASAEFTVFAPTNNAFAPVDTSVFSPMQLSEILTYHVVSGAVDAATVVGLTSATTVQGEDVTIDASSGVVLNGSTAVSFTDFEAENGIVHVIDGVLLPSAF